MYRSARGINRNRDRKAGDKSGLGDLSDLELFERRCDQLYNPTCAHAPNSLSVLAAL